MFSQLTYWHPIFVHFTVALWSTAFLFYFLSLFVTDGSRYKHQWLTVGRWNLWLGMTMTLLTITAGWVAYNSVNHDTPSHLLMQDHRLWALSTGTLFVLLTAWSLWLFARGHEEPKVFVLVMFLAVGLLGTTGWYGGELVYRHGLAVMSMPNPDEHDHDHGDFHDDMHGGTAVEGHGEMMEELLEGHDHDGHEHAPHSHE